MDMWPQSENPPVVPPKIKSMLGRPEKLRRKKAIESRKTGKLNRCGGQVTCSLCKAKGHNKRACPHVECSTSTVAATSSIVVVVVVVTSATAAAALSSYVVAASASVLHTGRGSGRGRGSAPPAVAASSSCGSTSLSGRGRGRGSAPPTGSSSMPYDGLTGASRRGRGTGC
ncbi:GPI-anchored hemophore cfmA-like [Nicotiana tomentosiformis]|uniref:GPI-anchored hemophore cfmA-like n=1 Tax=Nicotiana tomentosiformis TaxID=4098 RepID=UPI00388CB837